VTPDQLRAIKAKSGLSPSIANLISMAEEYIHPAEPLTCDGFSYLTFKHDYPTFTDTNNLSLVIYLELHGIGVLIPGDLETAGWVKMLERPDFQAILPKVSLL